MQNPIIHSVNYKSVFIDVIILLAMICIFRLFDKANCLIESYLTFMAVFIFLRYSFSRFYRKGVRAYKICNYEEAVYWFDKSIAYFEKHRNIDKFRCVTMLSNSKISYWEMGMLNKAFCLVQMDKRSEAIDLYKTVLDKNPLNAIAQTSLKMCCP